MARDDLIKTFTTTNWRVYPMEHQVCMPQINDIAAWLKQNIGLTVK